jgi:hypothetical protein
MTSRSQLAWRYAAYIGFALAALVLWFAYAIFVLGLFPVPYERACDPNCPEPSTWKHGLIVVGTLLPLPLTVLIFVFFRRWIHRLFGHEDE